MNVCACVWVSVYLSVSESCQKKCNSDPLNVFCLTFAVIGVYCSFLIYNRGGGGQKTK